MSKKADIWMPIYIGDYLADTSHLDAQRHGCYLLWMMHYWRKGPLPNDIDDLVSIGRLRGKDAPSIAQALLKDFFFLDSDGAWHQKRQDVEKAKWQEKAIKSNEKAKKAANVRWKKNATSNPQAMLTPCPSPSPSTTPKSEFVLPDSIPTLEWNAWLEVRKKKRASPTEHAMKLAVGKLLELQAKGFSPKEVLEAAILGNWTGIFEPTSRSNGQKQPINNANRFKKMEFL